MCGYWAARSVLRKHFPHARAQELRETAAASEQRFAAQ
jgi:hypothetical protein